MFVEGWQTSSLELGYASLELGGCVSRDEKGYEIVCCVGCEISGEGCGTSFLVVGGSESRVCVGCENVVWESESDA